jgi:uncharacterized Zn finger protein
MPPSSHNIQDPSTPTSIDPNMIRQHIRLLIRRLSSFHDRDTPRQTHIILNEIWRLVEYALLQLQRGEHAQALLTLKAVTDTCTAQGMCLNDFHSDVSTFFQDLTSIWTVILLTVDLTARERTRWAKQVTIWQTRLTGWSNSAFFDAPQAAIREGWNDVTLQNILHGTSLPPRSEEREFPSYAPVLMQARLAVLEQREQFQEYLNLAKAEGQTQPYVTMLVRQGQITEAIDYGLQHLTTAEDAFALAQELFAQNETSHSLHIAEHGLTLEGNLVPLANWLRDHSWSMGEQALALKAGEVAFHGKPTLDQYLHVARIAGTHWPEQRAKLLDYARHAPWTADPQGLVRLFLHEHLFDDAIAVLKTKQPYTLVAQVVEAALKEQTALEWVIQECKPQAEHIMNGAKASYYQGAALWLTRARTAYRMVGREEEWNAYLADLLVKHKHKSKLLPLLTALAREDQDGNHPHES